jgi:hypothetical protein
MRLRTIRNIRTSSENITIERETEAINKLREIL